MHIVKMLCAFSPAFVCALLATIASCSPDGAASTRVAIYCAAVLICTALARIELKLPEGKE